MGRERMPQRVRMCRVLGAMVEYPAHVAGPETIAARVEEHRIDRRRGPGGVAGGGVGPEFGALRGGFAQGHLGLLRALSPPPQPLFPEVDGPPRKTT